MELNREKAMAISDLSFAYEKTEVLSHLSCDFYSGERIAVLGPNGAGKSTFFHIISGLLSSYRGSVRIAGREIRELGRGRIAQSLALVPQRHEPVFPFLTRDFILMGRYSHLGTLGIPRRKDYQSVEQAAIATGITELLDRPYNGLSGGELQLVMVTRALAQDSKILVLDEPNSHLDFRNRFLILDLVRDISKQRGLTVLMSLHDPNDVVQFATRVLVLNGGKIIADGHPDNILTEDLLGRLYRVRVESISGDNGKRFFQPCGSYTTKSIRPC